MRTLVLTLFLAAAFFGPVGAVEDDRLATIHLPEGFVIEPFAEVPNARQMAWGEKGTLFVGTRREGRVFAVTDEDGDGRGERVREVASGLRMPSGVAFREGSLYVAAVSTILRFDEIESRLDDPPAPVIVTDRLPSEGHHGWKVLEFSISRAGRPSLSPGRRAVRCVPHGGLPRHHSSDASRRLRHRDLRTRPAELGGSCLAPGDGRAVVHRQRQRSPGPRPAARRVEQGSGSGPPLRVPVLPCWHAARPRFRRRRALRGYRAAFQRPGGPRGATRARHSLRDQRSASVYGRSVHRGTRTWEPERDDWLPGLGRAPRRRPQDRAGLYGIRPGMVRQRAGVGPAGRRPADILEAPDGSILVSDDRAGRIYLIRYVGR